MITNTGKDILAKYLVGQAPAYASYIALGCGPAPLSPDEELGDYSEKNNLDFEMFRVPITSRGYVNEDGIDKIVFTAELPTEERYEITEVGVFSAAANPSAGPRDSRNIYAFTQTENWEYHTEAEASAIPVVYEPLDGEDNNNVINQPYDVFQTNADNRIFTNSLREARYERCRFLNNIIAIAGDISTISENVDGTLSVDSGNHLHLNGISANLDRNAPTDELRFAFSVANKDGNSSDHPSNIKIIGEFANADAFGTGEFARFEVNIDHIQDDPVYDFSKNRYFVITKQLQELVKSTGFAWSQMNIAKVYVCISDSSGNPSNQYYLNMDALRLENVTTVNPLYGMTGYSIIKNQDAKTLVKVSNTTNFVEFRFAVGVQ